MVPEPTVYLVDDDPAMIAALRELVDQLGLKAAAFRSASEFLDAYSPDGPGCLVLDVRLPGMSGLELQKEILARGVQLPTIVVTGFGDVRMAVEAMKAGAMEFLEKPFRMQELCDCIQRVVKIDAANWHDRQQRRQAQQQLSILTQAEREVLGQVVAGKTNRLIAVDLGLSVRTVEDRRARMMRKLNVSSRAELLNHIGVDCSPLPDDNGNGSHAGRRNRDAGTGETNQGSGSGLP